MRKNYLLKSENAELIYTAVCDLPIIDYHNHVSLSDISAGKRFSDIYELWIKSDPYKHRLMRICGVSEDFITGGASPREKFLKFCEIFPFIAGNPVYDWARMEMSTVFGIDEPISAVRADYIYDKISEMLSSPEFSGKGILSRFNIEYQSPVANLFDDISDFDGIGIAPSLRADNLLRPTEELKRRLFCDTGIRIADKSSYVDAISRYLDKFDSAGCRFADHALDSGFFEDDIGGEEREILSVLACEYAKRGWTLLLHLDAKRKTSTRLAEIAGPAGGYAAVGGNFPISRVCELLGDIEKDGRLPDVVLFPLNMSDQAPISVMQGSFSEDNVSSKVQLGPAWWWCDHALGIENTLDSISSFGALSQFIGMTTDSRSILSFVRHDYFRRILSTWIARRNEEGEWNLPIEIQIEIARKICYTNAKNKIQRFKK